MAAADSGSANAAPAPAPGANPAVDQVAFRRAGRRQFLEQFLADAGVLAQFARLAARHAALLAADFCAMMLF